MSFPDELASLPKPTVVEELDVETILARKKTTLQGIYDREGLPLTVLNTAYEPSTIQLETSSEDELNLRARINDAARARLLAFATGADLDHLAAFYEVFRMEGESDQRLKLRVILAIQGRSTGGTEERYRYFALTADIRVADAIVYTVGRSPVIHVALFSTDATGQANAALISIVDAALKDRKVRMANDTIVVGTAIRTIVNLEANVWLLPSADLSTLQAMESSLRSAWGVSQALGRDFVSTWWVSKLMLDGVHKIEPVQPISDVVVPSDEAVAIGTVKLNFIGRGF